MAKPGKHLLVCGSLPVKAHNAGLFISRGRGGRHPERVIDSYELIFVRQGVLDIHEGGKAHTLGPGAAIILLPGICHGGTADYPADLSFYWVHFSLGSKAAPKSRTNPSQLSVPRSRQVVRPDRLAEIFRLFLNDQEGDEQSPAIADALLFLMLAEVANDPPASTRLDAAQARLAELADQLIKLRFHEDLQTSLIARQLRCNPDYLGRIYRQAYGRTLTEAIHLHRLKQARSLLLEGGRSIKEVAGECGFADAGYFQRLFRRAEGISPRAFRRLYARMHVNTE